MQISDSINIENFFAFGIQCKILKKKDLKLLYEWRNKQEIRKFMNDKRQVSMPVLEFWHKKISNTGKYFPYIVYTENIPCAYMEIKNIQYHQSTAELGIYIFGNHYIGKGIAEKVALCWEILLTRLGLKTAYALVDKDNARSAGFFEKIGGVTSGMKKNFCLYVLAEERRRTHLKKIAEKHAVEQEFLQLLDRAGHS